MNNINLYKTKKESIFVKKIDKILEGTVTSLLFTHIVSTEKMRKDMTDRKDMRGIKHTYYNGSFFYIASS